MRWFEAMVANAAWLAQLSGLLLGLAMVGHASLKTRIGVIAAAFAALAFALSTRHHGSVAFWAALVIAVNAIKIAQLELGERKTRFSERDEHLRHAMLEGLSRPQARALIDCGNWVNGKTDEPLMAEGEATTHLYFLHKGGASVSFARSPVGTCRPGDLIGDATAISGAPATATVKLTEPSELWCIWADELRKYLALHPEVRSVLEHGLNSALRDKLSSANQRLAERAAN
ncbi:MAG TPA: cyclic nucleotide-binding domain-containing protein [Sphingomonas sp.]|nr:cyclic nucleotide-binding domain-containing protein [Sphingomonas sp.]